jgi:UDP-N-acetylmuramate dehydrogenase
MKIEENISLKPYNTFGIEARAKYFASFSNADQLIEILAHPSAKNPFVLGGGSNILIRGDMDKMVLKNDVAGIEVVREDEHHVYVKVGAGQNWHQLVLYCIQRDWAGIENLSLIPGNVGAAPMQNIGAYGVELKEVFEELEAYYFKDRKILVLSNNDCEFNYRDSAFKGKWMDQFIILSVTLRLNKVPVFHTNYGAIREELDKMGVKDLSIGAISNAVIRIRESKLPDPSKIGNAGSFFKNPSVSASVFDRLSKEFPGIVGYKNEDGTIKLAAGWLIEHCGWRGFRRGDAGVHQNQALVLVNYGKASGQEIYDLSTEILESVKNKYSIILEREVNVV